jgi:hypothetical protein
MFGFGILIQIGCLDYYLPATRDNAVFCGLSTARLVSNAMIYPVPWEVMFYGLWGGIFWHVVP